MNGQTDEPSESQERQPKSFDDFELTLGDIMRGERATLGKSLLEVQRDIKIKAEYLAAIEDTDLTAFETPGFIAGYVRSYARYLNMNPDWVYRAFCEESGFSHVAGLDAQVYTKRPIDKQPTPMATSTVSDAILARSPIYAAPQPGFLQGLPAGAIVSLTVLCLLMGGLGYGGWQILQQIQRVTLAPVESGITVVPEEVTTVASGPDVNNEAPTTAALERLYRPQALDTPVLVPRDAPIATLDPQAQGVFASYTDPALPPVPVPPQVEGPPGFATETEEPVVQVVEAPPPEVVLFARRPAWVRVRAADGTVLLEKILEQGERFILPDTEQPPTLRAGNSGSVFFAVKGETFGPAGPGTSVAKNVILSAENLSDAYGPANLEEDPELARIAELAALPVETAPTE